MKLVDGWWVTDGMSGPGAFTQRARLSGLENYKGGIAIQAGGHIGVYPLILSEFFRHVYTFEPDFDNHQCLVRNCSRPNIYVARGALGFVRGTVGVNKHKNSGGHMIDGEGYCPIYRIDDMALDSCDLIYLDVEGYEVHALRGALKTISAYKPIIVAEENKKLKCHGFNPGDIEKLLSPFGYKTVNKLGEDLILECIREAV